MKTKRLVTCCALIAGVGLLIACTPMPTPAPTEAPAEAWYERAVEVPEATPEPQGGWYAPDAEAPPEEDPDGGEGYGDVLPAPAGGFRVNRLIIKDALISLLVRDTDVAIDRVTQVVADVGGYIISSRVWHEEVYGEGYKYATTTIGVPVDQFERALQRLRDLAVKVVDEQASGEDVTDEYVDLQSRLDNLTATRDRIRLFLEQAETVEEALKVNEELAAIEEQIETVQGRMNYLFDRASYSTITIQIEPEATPPTPTPTYTPSPTSTPTPTPTPTPWSLSPTVESAGRTLGSIVRGLVEFLTWTGIVILPLVVPLVLVVLGVRALLRRRKGRPSAGGEQ